MTTTELTKGEAYAVAKFIDAYIFDTMRTDTDWDKFQNLWNLLHAYEKCCKLSGYVGMTDSKEDADGEEVD